MDILEFRKNFSKPIIIDFRNPNLDYNPNKIKKLNEFLKARIFNLNSTTKNNVKENDLLSDMSLNIEFPIKLNEIVENKKGLTILKDPLHDRLSDVCREIHGSLLVKDDLIKQIKEKYILISKSSLIQFFKAYTERVFLKKFSRVF